MFVASINNDNIFDIKTIDDWEKNKERISKIIKLYSLKDTNPKVAINEILTILFNLHSIIKTNEVNTYIIHKEQNIQYCLFTYSSKEKSNNHTIISRLIDNSYQTNYNEETALLHDNNAVICKIDGKEILEITREEVLDIIKNSFIPRALLIDDNVNSLYYNNNPVFNIEGFDVYTVITFGDKNIRIYVDTPDTIEFDDYDNITSSNKELYRGLFNKWNLFKVKQYPKNTRLIISLHDGNVNISINKEIEEKIIKFLSN